jgi:shikimate dehydrogenase
MFIDQDTALYGVIGYPLGHTQSPAMHNAAFSENAVNAVYLAFESKDIDGCVQGMRALGIKGMSITTPHKSTVIPLLDEVDDLAVKIGAVNTIVNHGGYLVGYNTDAMGALRALEEKTDPAGKSCLIIGAGGAARAIGFILKERGAHLIIANRSGERGDALAHSLGCAFLPLERVKEIQADLFIHATSVGMYPRDDACIVAPDILQNARVVMDVVYNPLETKLLKFAAKQGCSTINGLGMLVHQGAEQFRLWTGLEAPISTMRKAVENAIGVSDEGDPAQKVD